MRDSSGSGYASMMPWAVDSDAARAGTPTRRAGSQRAEQERQRAEQAHQRAEQAYHHAERLAAQLRALGINPEQ